MKRLYLLIFAIMAVTARAQIVEDVMRVFTNDGQEDVYRITDIDSVTFKWVPQVVEEDDNMPDGNDNGHPYIDLGLPSGLKWATYNIGATAPEESGNSYKWGETTIADDERFTTNKYFADDWFTTKQLLKYNVNEKQGPIDNKTVLEPEDDVAHVVWGGNWRMPTQAETVELRRYCQFEETTLNGVEVTKITGPNKKYIYLSHLSPIIWASSLCTGGYAEDYCSYSFAMGVPYSIHNTLRGIAYAVRAVTE